MAREQQEAEEKEARRQAEAQRKGKVVLITIIWWI